MKKIYTLALSVLHTTFLMAQQPVVSDFETFNLPPDSFLNGSTQTNNPLWKGFLSGNALFTNTYDTSFGFWSDGFALSNKKDTTTSGFTNLYSAITAGGYTSETYAVGQQGAWIVNTDTGGQMANGVYVTNTTYAALSMRDGDFFAKKFGGPNGTDPDFFVMHFIGYHENQITDTVSFYLADFRSPVSSEDYILTSWAWVDLTSIGKFDSITIRLESSDTGQFGINTPLFYAIDNFTATPENSTGLADRTSIENTLAAYPNPVLHVLHIPLADEAIIQLVDAQGRVVLTTSDKTIRFDDLQSGMYILHAQTATQSYQQKIYKP